MIKLPQFEAANPTLHGEGLSVVVIDSGFDLLNPSFGIDADSNGAGDRITYSYDFADHDTDATETPFAKANIGTFSHGTFVASLVAGENRTATTANLRGVATEADIIALKVARNVLTSDNELEIPNYAILSALDWVISNATTRNIAAVNLSLGADNVNQALFLSNFSSRFRSLEDMGVVVVAAAGNSYSLGGSTNSPGVSNFAADENVVAVGAVVDTNFSETYNLGTLSQLLNQQAYFSQRHDRLLDVLAPGVNMVGAMVGTGWTIAPDDGTSYASPLVTGAAVLVQQQAQTLLGRKLKTSEFRALIQTTSSTLTDVLTADEGTAYFDVTNLGVAFPLLNIQAAGSAAAIQKYAFGTPRAIATSPIVQAGGTGGIGSTRTANFSWDSGPESTIFDVTVQMVRPDNSRRTVWSNMAYNPGGTPGGVQVNSTTATWTVQSGDSDYFIWWVRAWNGAPLAPSYLNHGEWSLQRRLYLVPNVAVPIVPAFVGATDQPLNEIDLWFSPVPHAAVYDIEVDRLINLDLTSTQATARGPYGMTGILFDQSISGNGIPAGTTIVGMEWIEAAIVNGNFVAAFTRVTLSNAATLSVANAALRIDRYLKFADSTTSRIRPTSELPIGTYRTRVQAINQQNESSGFSTYTTFTVADRDYSNPVYLGASEIGQNHVFRYSDSNPIGQYLATVVLPAAFTLNASINAATTQLNVSNIANLAVGMLLRIDAEVVLVQERAGDAGSTLPPNTIRVTRGWDGGTNPIIHNVGTLIRRIFQESTTESSIRFNQILPAGNATLEIRSISETGNFFFAATSYAIVVVATLAAPTTPVYTGPVLFTGPVTLTWTSSVTADTYDVIVKRNNSTFLEFRSYAGRSISLNDLKSGFYQTENGVRVYHQYQYTLFLQAKNSNKGASAWTAAIPFNIDRAKIPKITASQITVSSVAGGPSTLRRFDWIANPNVKFYEVYIGIAGAAQDSPNQLLVSAYVTENTFYASFPPLPVGQSYRVWLRPFSFEDSIEEKFISLWSDGVTFTVS